MNHQNLLGKLWFVWRVFEENAPDEIHVNHEHIFALGHSELLGAFLQKRDARNFAQGVPLARTKEDVVVREGK